MEFLCICTEIHPGLLRPARKKVGKGRILGWWPVVAHQEISSTTDPLPAFSRPIPRYGCDSSFVPPL